MNLVGLTSGQLAHRTRVKNNILNALNNLPYSVKTGHGSTLTSNIINVVATAGSSPGVQVYAYGARVTNRPFLYDVSWRREDHTNQLLNIKLAFEFELDLTLGEIMHEFEKIISSGAEIGILVYDKAADRNEDLVFGKIIEQISTYRGYPCESFYAIRVDRKEGYFEYYEPYVAQSGYMLSF